MNELDLPVQGQAGAPALERYDRPRNYGPLERWDGHARLTGACGDTMEFWLRVEQDRIVQAGFATDGCGPSRAAGSMATELALGRELEEAIDIQQAEILRALGGLPKESEHCASLSAGTLRAAIDDYFARRREAEATRVDNSP